MARLIPEFPDDRTPPGENAVFRLLSNAPVDWTALHALDLAPWNRNRRTEIDFVVIIPDTGVLCIEVKSQAEIQFDGLRWHPPEIKRSPFKQATDASHSLHRRLSELNPNLKSVPMSHCCIFPSARFELSPNVSVAPWELIDARKFLFLKDPEKFCSELRSILRMAIEHDPALKPLPRRLSVTDVEGIVRACTPVQTRSWTNRDDLKSREEEAERALRLQQRPILSLVRANPRVVVSGAAGTGKTLIAIEIAKLRSDRGERVGLLCFNQQVGNWLKRKVASERTTPNLIVGRAIKTMADLAGVSIPDDPEEAYWEETLPTALEERLTDPEVAEWSQFDHLILDEAQDLLARPRLWNCIGQFLRGGFAEGSWLLLGDFDHQVLTDKAAMESTLHSVSQLARPARFHLTENCRNFRAVGEHALVLSGLPPDTYSGYLRPRGDDFTLDIAFYRDDSEQEALLKSLLQTFKSRGYGASDITLLSWTSAARSAAERLKSSGVSTRPAWQTGGGVGYSSIHGFKGMETRVAIITDVLLGGDSEDKSLFYTGITRALDCVRILCHESSRPTLVRWLSQTPESNHVR